MNITLLAIGSRGDVQPLVALGVGLRQRGHAVRLVAGDEFEALAGGAGLEFVPLGLNIQAAMAAHTDLFRFAHSLTDRIVQACAAPAEALAGTILGVSACAVARQRGLPYFYIVPTPGLCTAAFPDPLFPPLPLGGTYNRFTFRLTERLVKQSYPAARSLFVEPRPTYLFCFSEHVVPRPPDWEAFAHVTGYWFLNDTTPWQPPPALEAFMRAGPPPVYVGFGSTLTRDAQRLTQIVVEALALARQRGVLVAGWGGLNANALPPEIYALESASFDWLFPRVCAAVHHGGAGTTAAALRAGLPSVVVPFALDQPFWARRLAALGAAPAPILATRLTASRLADALRRAGADEPLRTRAAQLGEKLRAEDGVGRAVQIMEQVVSR